MLHSTPNEYMTVSQSEILKGRWSALKNIIYKVLEITLFVIIFLLAFAVKAK